MSWIGDRTIDRTAVAGAASAEEENHQQIRWPEWFKINETLCNQKGHYNRLVAPRNGAIGGGGADFPIKENCPRAMINVASWLLKI